MIHHARQHFLCINRQGVTKVLCRSVSTTYRVSKVCRDRIRPCFVSRCVGGTDGGGGARVAGEGLKPDGFSEGNFQPKERAEPSRIFLSLLEFFLALRLSPGPRHFRRGVPGQGSGIFTCHS